MKQTLLCFFSLLCITATQAQIQLDAPGGGYYLVIDNNQSGPTTIEKYLADGTPDLSYGTAGVSEPIDIWKVVGAGLLSDGKIALGGMTETNDIHTDQVFAGVNPDGTIAYYDRRSLTILSNDYLTSFSVGDDKILWTGFAASLLGDFGVYQISVIDPSGNSFFVQSPSVSPLDLFNPDNYQYQVFFNGNQTVLTADLYMEAADGQTPGYSIVESSLYISGAVNLKSRNIQDPNTGKYGLVLEQYNTDGSADQAFNENSLATIQYLFDLPLIITSFERVNDKIIVTAGETRVQFNSDGSFDKVLGDEVEVISFTCPSAVLVGTNSGVCTALVGGIDPVTSKPENISAISYTLAGATSGSGTGSVSNMAFNKGVTTVTYFETNNPANTCSFTVTVQDREAPVISGVSASLLNIWPPNNKLVNVAISYAASDNCGTVTTTVAVSSNEIGMRPGDEQDWIIVNNRLVQLRAEKGKNPKDRIYTITITATDAAGNTTSKSIKIGVQKDAPAGFISYRNTGIDLMDEESLQVTVLNNPSSAYFTLNTRSNSKAKLALRVVNEAGQVMETRSGLAPNNTLHVGGGFRSGLYFAEFMQDGQRVTVKLLKR
ncbi:MAG: T9SS type A sorting domain-containing protein [Bacteroidota bacterium]